MRAGGRHRRRAPAHAGLEEDVRLPPPLGAPGQPAVDTLVVLRAVQEGDSAHAHEVDDRLAVPVTPLVRSAPRARLIRAAELHAVVGEYLARSHPLDGVVVRRHDVPAQPARRPPVRQLLRGDDRLAALGQHLAEAHVEVVAVGVRDEGDVDHVGQAGALVGAPVEVEGRRLSPLRHLVPGGRALAEVHGHESGTGLQHDRAGVELPEPHALGNTAGLHAVQGAVDPAAVHGHQVRPALRVTVRDLAVDGGEDRRPRLRVLKGRRIALQRGVDLVPAHQASASGSVAPSCSIVLPSCGASLHADARPRHCAGGRPPCFDTSAGRAYTPSASAARARSPNTRAL